MCLYTCIFIKPNTDDNSHLAMAFDRVVSNDHFALQMCKTNTRAEESKWRMSVRPPTHAMKVQWYFVGWFLANCSI